MWSFDQGAEDAALERKRSGNEGWRPELSRRQQQGAGM
jgi:hypothetical protein